MQSRTVALVAVVASLLVFIAATAAAETSSPTTQTALQATQPQLTPLADSCNFRFKQSKHRSYIREVYRRDRISQKARQRIERIQRCSYSKEATRNMRADRKQAAALRRQRAMRVQVPPVLHRIAQCESNGNPTAISAGGTYRGKYQFSFSTWRSVGGRGDPAAASEAEQDRRALRLLRTGGLGHWPVCGPRAVR